MDNYVIRMLGLAHRAGKTVFGTALVRDAVRGHKKPSLVLLASDASENTKKRISDSCTFYGVELARLDISGEELAKVLGKASDVMCVAVTDESMANAMKEKIDETMFIKADNGESAGGRA